MSIGRISSHAMIALLAVLTAACATSPAATGSTGAAAGDAASATADPAAENTIRVEVRQNRLDGGAMTVYIEPSAGVRTTLGMIDPGETKTFTYNAAGANRNVKLSALDATGRTTTSTAITVPRGAGLTWDIQVNALRIKR